MSSLRKASTRRRAPTRRRVQRSSALLSGAVLLTQEESHRHVLQRDFNVVESSSGVEAEVTITDDRIRIFLPGGVALPVGAVFTCIEEIEPGGSLGYGTWSELGSVTVGDTEVFYWLRTA